MAIEKKYIRQYFKAAPVVPVQALTGSSTATQITNFGLTTITHTSTADKSFKLARPIAGAQKTIAVRNGGSTQNIFVRSASTAVTFFPTTSNLLDFAGANPFITLVGISTSQWAIAARSTGITLTGSTLD
jgi:hypothetical protein